MSEHMTSGARSAAERAGWMRGYATALLEYRSGHPAEPVDPGSRGVSLAGELQAAADALAREACRSVEGGVLERDLAHLEFLSQGETMWLLGYAAALDAHGYRQQTIDSLAAHLRDAAELREAAEAVAEPGNDTVRTAVLGYVADCNAAGSGPSVRAILDGVPGGSRGRRRSDALNTARKALVADGMIRTTKRQGRGGGLAHWITDAGRAASEKR